MKLSVAMCTYNGEFFLKEQIDSILNQTLKVDEIIICDDGSTDNTLSLLDDYSNKKPNLFKIYKNEINLKSVKNFEKAIELCSGDIIFLSDQDDIWVENKVEDYINYFNYHPNINVLASNGYCIDDQSKIHEKYSIWDVPQFLREQNIHFNYFLLISNISNIATGASMAIRKEIIPDIVPFPIISNFHHDEWIALITSKTNSFELLNEKYFYYRAHENQQVGGVFFNKNNEVKRSLIEIFNISQDKASYISFKRKLKKICNAYIKNHKLLKINTKHNRVFEENLIQIESLFLETKKKFKQYNTILYYFISITDIILNKRQLNKKL
jgi:glycosyltransferase involved in cell wall biosynthesis